MVHFLRKNLVNKAISSVQVQEDNIIYGKVGTSATAFQQAMTGKKVLDARQQGKYFWLVMNSPPHPVMHLGMTGWIKFSNDSNSHYRAKKEADEEWPPRFWKFILKTEDDGEVAFVDARRLARIRLVDCEGEDLRQMTPLKENGPDPVIDKDILTLEWLTTKMRSKKVPVKALLLDQANISGVGNWVADEVLFQARIHPEQYSNTFNDAQLKGLHDKLIYVCTTACELLAESDKYPADWLMQYRWDKGKKGEVNKLPNGEKIVHLKVGGRTSAIVPSLQKKTAAVAGDVSGTDGEDDEVVEEKAANKKRKASGKGGDVEGGKNGVKKRGRKVIVKESEDDKAEMVESKKAKTGAKSRGSKNQSAMVKVEDEVGADGEGDEKPAASKLKASTEGKDEGKTKKATTISKAKATPGSRRSGRLSGGAV